MRELGANGVEARILNISESGFMAIADGHFEVGSRVWLMLPGRDRANAVVKWTAGDKLGAEFAEPIALEGLTTAEPFGRDPAPALAPSCISRSARARPLFVPCNRARRRSFGQSRKEVCNGDRIPA